MDETTTDSASGSAGGSLDPKEAEELLNALGTTASKTTGRIRFRLREDLRTPEAMAQVQAQLEKDERVSEVTINQRTGSVTVKHEAQHDGHKLLHETLSEAKLLAEVALDLPEEEEEGEGGGAPGESGYAKLDSQVADLIYNVDRAIYERTNGKIHLRGRVIPAAIAGVGIAQIAIYGIGLELLPGPVLLWIAYDIYHKVNKDFATRGDLAAMPTAEMASTGTAMAEPTGPLNLGAAPAAA